MIRIHPFRAIRPAPDHTETVASVPYDVVNRTEAAQLADGNPESFLHVVRSEIDLPSDVEPYDDRVYEKAAENFNRFRADGVLIQDETPCLYLYRQIMGNRSQVGLVACCHIDDYENNLIKKHEKTRQAKEDDRTRHVLAINANSGPVFLTYRREDEIDNRIENAMRTHQPVYDFTALDGVRHTVWNITETSPIVRAFQAVSCAYVADGHHRSASAWRAGQQKRDANPDHTGDEEYNWFLCVLFPDEQLSILPYNRVISDMNGLTVEQAVEQLKSVGSVRPTNEPVPDRSGTFCFYFGNGRWYRVAVNDDLIDRDDPIASLDVAILQDRILGPIFAIGDPRTDDRIDFVGGIRGTAELEKRVDQDCFAAAVSMYPTSIDQLLCVADADLVMPPKSTWFEPKLRSGLFAHSLD